jgi:hypothetical protein
VKALLTVVVTATGLLSAKGPGLARADAGAGRSSPPQLTKEQATKTLTRLLEREPFWPRHYEEADPKTLGKFFAGGDYRLLQGNPFLGYWDSGTFRWPATTKAIAWEGVVGAKEDVGARSVTAKAWRAAMEVVAGKRGLVIDQRAAVRIRGVCVHATLERTRDGLEPPGVLVELRLESPNGALLMRVGVGKPTIEEAMGAMLDWVVGFALRVHQPQGDLEAKP